MENNETFYVANNSLRKFLTDNTDYNPDRMPNSSAVLSSEFMLPVAFAKYKSIQIEVEEITNITQSKIYIINSYRVTPYDDIHVIAKLIKKEANCEH